MTPLEAFELATGAGVTGTQIDFSFESEAEIAYQAAAHVADIDFLEVFTQTDSDLSLYSFNNFEEDPDNPAFNILGAHTFPDDLFLVGGPRDGENVGIGLFDANNTFIEQGGAATGSGDTGLTLLLHEIGHGLGLGHPFDTGNGSTTLAGGDPLLDHRYTVMAGTANGPSPFEDVGRPVSYMALDIAALQHMYGPNNFANVGATSYQLTDPDSTALDLDGSDGDVSIGLAFYSIWDTSGTDEITYSGAFDVLINLNDATLKTTLDPVLDSDLINLGNELVQTTAFANLSLTVQDDILNTAKNAGGFFSQIVEIDPFRSVPIPDMSGITIANGAIVENGTGGSGDDLLIGNEQRNLLTGNTGNDGILGGSGNDTLLGGGGNDEMLGGIGNDLLNGGNGRDELEGGSGSDTLEGRNGKDFLEGGAGADTLLGGTGEDTAVYESSASAVTVNLATGIGTGGHAQGDSLSLIENLIGSAFSDSLVGDGGINRLQGGNGNDTLNGGDSNDILFGQNGGDSLIGGSGNDTLVGGTGGDFLDGGGGADSLNGGDAADTLMGGNAADTLSGGIGNDEISGDNGNDILRGNGNRDLLDGGAGSDTLFGGNGSDTLRGGTGNDVLDGSAGPDEYLFLNGDGNDTISVFQDGLDLLDLSQHANVTDFGDLTETQLGANLLIGFDVNDSVLIENFQESDFDGDDVFFGL